jgi:ribose transport system substrate-binding protein
MIMAESISRREILKTAGVAVTGSLFAACEKRKAEVRTGAGAAPGEKADFSGEEYVWISPHANLPLYVAHDHPALFNVARELGVQVTIAGPDTVDIPATIAAIEQTAARKPAGIMVSGWDPSAFVAPINMAIESGIPVVTVDVDVPRSKRLAFIGTDWFDLGAKQAEAMIRALKGRRGKVALIGMIEQYIDQQGFAGFRSVAEKAGLTVLDPQQDKGNSAEAARVAGDILQATPDLVGMAGFDSETGPGIGMALRETGKAGQVIGTTVDAEEQHLRLVKDGILVAAVGQKRELFSHFGVKALFEARHSTVRFTRDDVKAGVVPIPEIFYCGSYTVTRENVDYFLKA